MPEERQATTSTSSGSAVGYTYDSPYRIPAPPYEDDDENNIDNVLFPHHKQQRSLHRRFNMESNTARMIVLLLAMVAGSLFYRFWKTEKAMNMPWTPDPGSRLFSQRPLPSPVEGSFIKPGGFELPLRTKGRDIVDQKSRRFKLASVNWYGASDELFIPGGLDVRHRNDIAELIRNLGFNSVRMPYSDEMVMSNPHILPHLLTANPDLIGLRALDIFEAVVLALTEAGIAVIVNDHITSATWCCGADPCDAGWANDHLGPLCRVRQTEDDWIEHWKTVMERFVNNPLVIGADLRNEVRGVWGTMTWDRWATAAEKAGNALLKMNPDWLIVVGGTESSNDLAGAGERPVKLDVDNRVVYSAHVYAWSGWGSMGGRYAKRSYPSFVKSMRQNWGYLVEGNLAPVWIGEFGAPDKPSEGDANYWQNLMRYLKAIDADFGYWAINPRKPKENAKESYALVEDDWNTPVLDYRMKDMTELIRS
ncbi:glycoside hydrolase superfamily [Cercophora newfieldiana]|uniref:Glycoside hydrolase superfamily n=1 Tax=Cercophora newfieldiana TaxID=92897 RepID=A0AA39YTS1_9PEZI|nr:glycoside hydrolase superfamily [Cercophora newfieldiana]